MTMIVLLALGIAKFLAPIMVVMDTTTITVHDLPRVGRAARYNLGLSLLWAAKQLKLPKER